MEANSNIKTIALIAESRAFFMHLDTVFTQRL